MFDTITICEDVLVPHVEYVCGMFFCDQNEYYIYETVCRDLDYDLLSGMYYDSYYQLYYDHVLDLYYSPIDFSVVII